MTNVTLLPLSLGELLDRTFSYYRKHFVLFVGIMALPQVVVIGLSVLFQVFSQGMGVNPSSPQDPKQAAAQAAALAVKFLITLIAFLIAYLLVYSTALGATTFALSEIHLGRSTTIRDAYRIVWQKLGRLFNVVISILIRSFGLLFLVMFGVAMLVGILMVPLGKSMGAPAVAVGMLIFFAVFIGAAVLTVIFLLRYSVAVPALLLENLSARQAIKRSVALTKGYLGRLFLVMFLMTLIGFVVSLLFEAPFTVAILVAAVKGTQPSLWLTIPNVVAGGIGRAISAPLLVIGFALAYYDMRVRKEGFDLELMMSQLGQASPVAGGAAQAPVATGARLEDASVLALVVLSFLTAGIYTPVWFMRRRKAINNLRSSEKLGLSAFIVALVVFSANLGLAIAGSYIWGSWVEAQNALGPIPNLVLLPAGILIVVQCFKVRRIILDHLSTRSSGLFSSSIAMQHDTSFSGVATFFLGIFYLQYKINNLLPSLAPDEASRPLEIQPSSAPAVPPVTS